jgi:Mg-chelatase subunit ChlD
MKKKTVIIIASVVAVVVLAVVGILLAGSMRSSRNTDVAAGETPTPTGAQTPIATASPPTANPLGDETIPSYLLLAAKEPPALDGFLQSAPDLVGKPGVDFQLLETGEANDWGDIPVPLINPLGSKSLYSSVYHRPADSGSTEITYLEGTSQIKKEVSGESWELRIEDDNLTTNYIRWYAQEMGATLYQNADDTVTFIKREGDVIWYGMAVWDDLSYPRARLYVVRQNILPVGKTITIRPSDTTDNCYYFTTLAGSGDFLTLFAEISGPGENVGAEISAWQDIFTGLLRREFYYRKSLDSVYCKRYALDDIPQSDEPVYWCVRFDTGKYQPESVTIRIEKTGTVEPVKISDRFGSIKVVGATGNATVSDQSGINRIVHLDGFTYNGIVDGDGNTIFHLPPGYYNIRANLPGGGGGSVRMVPVNGGELTEVILPDEFKSTYAAMETLYGSFETNMGSITINSNKDNGDTAEVSILINDPLKRDVFPEKENITITEGSAKAEILNIVRQTASVNVVLVIDTSGSMKNYMQPTIDAAKRFVEGLPDTANIRLVSFEQNVKEHSGSGKETVLKALDTLKASGGTSLYDATAKALTMLSGMDNAFIVVFADGADSRELKNQGKGSDLTRDQILAKLRESDITLLTIGFGEGHDPTAMVAMSNANGKGAYFPASDETTLDQAFAACAGKFGNEFVITYKRPDLLTDVNSEQPVVGVMIDDSGSMGSYRDAVMTMFHDFFTALPQGSLIQFSKFGDVVDMMHITTDQKAVLMQAMGETGETGGGTEIIKSLKTAVDQLKPLPTNKKVFIFLTDAAMDEVRYAKSEAELVLARFKEEGIRCLFVGVADAQSAEEAFKTAASLTGGDYIITDDIAEVEKKLDELLQKVSVPMVEKELLPFTIGVKAKTEDGAIMDYYAAAKLSDFSPRTVAGKALEPRATKIVTGGAMVPLYDSKTASTITGGTKPAEEELVITGHVSYDPPPESTATGSQSYGKSGKNKMVEMTVRDAYTFDVFGGVRAHPSKQFIALNLDVSFIGSSLEAYKIPSIAQHFYLSINNQAPVPASKATWLAAEPLAAPGEYDVTIQKGTTKSGALVFYVEKPETITQLALHYYDTAYGHIQIPLTGKISEYLTAIEELPATAPSKITDSFSMTVTGKTDLNEYGDYKPNVNDDPNSIAALQNKLLRQIQVRFDSKVQALFQIDPMARFYYVIDTQAGPLMAKMNDLVYQIPLGFTGDTLLAPGSSNMVYMPYEMPVKLAEASSWIFGDIMGGSVNLPVTTGSPYVSPSAGLKFSHEYFDLTVNALCVDPSSESYFILDITVTDKMDGYGTTGLDSIFALENSQETDESRRYNTADNGSSNLLYGIGSDWAVFDGQSRRGFLKFYAYGKREDLTLRSPYFPDMAVKIDAKRFEHPELLVVKQTVQNSDDRFESEMDKAITAAVSRYQANRPSVEEKEKPLNLPGDTSTGLEVPAPSGSVFGDQVLRSLTGLQDFYYLMYALRWLPAENRDYYYAPEAVITQGWGTQYDIYMLAENALSRLGIPTSFRKVMLTKKGKEALSHLSGVDDVRTNELPSIAYTDDKGQARIFVIPFMRDITELSGLVYLPASQGNDPPRAAYVDMTITANVEGAPEQDASVYGMFGSLGSTMGGSTGQETEKVSKEIVLFDEKLLIPSLSQGPIDIGYFAAAKSDQGADIIKAVVDTPDGLLQGKAGIDTGVDTIKSVTVTMKYYGGPYEGATHTTYLNPGDKLTDICHTMAFGLPELPENSASYLAQESAKVAKGGTSDASNASKVRWFTRSAIYRYIAAATAYDKEMAKQLKLVLGRVSTPLVFMITSRSDGTNALASFDLMATQNQVLMGETDNINAYRLFGGMHASVLEGDALADGSGVSIMEVWQSLPKGTGFVFIEDSREAREIALEKMAGQYPEVLLNNIRKAYERNTSTVFFVPSAPGQALGKPRWAWLEIDSRTFEAISVFDTGERSGMAGYVIGISDNKEMMGYVGYFVGLSCASWSISAYSLETENYAEIREKAAVMCAIVLEQIEELLSLAESGPIDYLTGKLKDEVGQRVGGSSWDDIKKFTDVEIPAGFSEGYKLAVEIYFGLK